MEGVVDAESLSGVADALLAGIEAELLDDEVT
jgi:hypothetical protein